MNQYIEKRNEKGFTLIELLIAIVVVGILAAVAIVGIAGLTNTGSKSACTVSRDAAKASAAAFYANQTPNVWPKDFNQMVTATVAAAGPPVVPANTPPVYELASGVTVNAGNAKELDGSGWKLIGTFDVAGAAAPDFTQSATVGCL